LEMDVTGKELWYMLSVASLTLQGTALYLLGVHIAVGVSWTRIHDSVKNCCCNECLVENGEIYKWLKKLHNEYLWLYHSNQ
jgi:hypothetical protein